MAGDLTTPMQVKSLVDRLVVRLEEAILSGELAPGSRVSEHSLAMQLNVSRSPLREAISRLEGKKLVQRKPNFGARVAEQSTDDLCELLVVREALEGMACRHAAVSITDAELSHLDRLLKDHGKNHEALEEGAGSYLEGYDVAFHFSIIKASRNKRLIGMLCEDLYSQLRLYRYKASSTKGRPRQSYQEHRAILEALIARDPEAAEVAMRHHIASSRAVALARIANLASFQRLLPAMGGTES